MNPPPIRPGDLDFLQFTNVQGNEGTDGMDGVSNANVGVVGIGDVYANQDLTGIEGLTYLDAEQKLWSDITNEAGWLNMHSSEKDTNITERDPLMKALYLILHRLMLALVSIQGIQT